MRKCGECTLCCTTQRVPELEKPGYTACQFCEIKKGCKIYDTRPKSCRDFDCAWLQGDMPDWMWPYKSHVLIEKHEEHGFVLALPEPGHKNWCTPEIEKILIETYRNKGLAVIASNGFAMLPEGMSAQDLRNKVGEVKQIMECKQCSINE
jgi:hypothetical protein